jgi:LAS superfamily LD-carboxypeptidase LdcB
MVNRVISFIIIRNARLTVHLDKCRRAYEKECKEAGKKVGYRACRFNYQHQAYQPEIKHHEERCSDRFNVVESIRYHNSGTLI